MNFTPSKSAYGRLLYALIVALAAISQSHAVGRFALKAATHDSGGSHSQGARFAVEGTVGQHDAGGNSQGARFAVRGGFWPAATASTANSGTIFSNGFEG